MEIKSASYEQIRGRHSELTEAMLENRLTEAMLDAAISEVVEDPGDGPPESIGFDWLLRNPGVLAAVASGPAAFMRRHLDNRYFAAIVILIPELFSLMPTAERADYVRESVMRHGSWNQGWIPVALRLDVPREEVAAIILDKLEACVVVPRCVGFLTDFVKDGASNFHREACAWDVLTDEQFLAAMRICARKAPHEVLHAHAKIGPRAKQNLAVIIEEAVAHVDRVGDPSAVAHLPLDARIAFARRLTPFKGNYEDTPVPTMRFLAELLIEVAQVSGMAAAKALFQELKAVIQKGSAPTLYQTVLTAAKRDSPERKARPDTHGVLDKIQYWLEDVLLPEQGYELGTIEVGVRNDQRHKGQKQMQVWRDPRVFVQVQSHSHRYSPREGDLVLFQPDRASYLARNVWAAHFIPCDPSREY